MSKIMVLLLAVVASIVALPLASAVLAVLPAAPPVLWTGAAWIAFGCAHVAAFFVIPRLPSGSNSLRAEVKAATVWTVAGACLWLVLLFLMTGSAFAGMSRWLTLVAEAAFLVALLAGLMAIRVLRSAVGALGFRLALAAAVSVVVSSLVVAVVPFGAGPYAPLIAAGLLLASNVIAFYGLVLRRRPSLVPYVAVAGLVWIVAAHLVWLGALFLSGQTLPPRWLPVLTTALQWLLAIGAPTGLQILLKAREGTLFYDPARRASPNSEVHVFRGTAQGARTAWIISYAQAANHPRVIRQSKALLDDGWRVVVCSNDGHSARPPEWTFVRFADSEPYRDQYRQLLLALNVRARTLCAHGPRWLSRLAAHVRQETINNWRYNATSMLDVLRENPDLKPDLVISHDYFTANAGYRVARAAGAKFAIDCQEYAPMQYSYDPEWLRWERPYIVEIQDYYVRRADLVFTVCDGIAELLNSEHKLKQPVVTIRNVPIKELQPFRPAGERIKVLYHGGIWGVRGLRETIQSMQYWRPEFDLILRGDGDAPFIAELRQLARELGLEDRVSFEPPVPFNDIIPSANQADIGYFSYDDYSPQIKFALPNKFFEFMMAGLCICVSDLEEVAKICDAYKVGRLIPKHSPEMIAQTINSFTREEIDRFKRASLAAADVLNWDREQLLYVGACNKLFVGSTR
ncbi:glycosyltransferase [Bosea sp. TWI1241]|uniref:glycosyltransferase n=1 Tax=Bosea sp. TWI1241 TaxID=3148904 RepID=UPI0032087840